MSTAHHLTPTVLDVGACKSELYRYQRYYLPNSAYIIGQLTMPVLPRRFTSRQLLFFRIEDCYLQKSTWFREAECSLLQYGHRWTCNHIGSYTDAYNGHDFPCGESRISGNAGKYIQPIPSGLRSGSHGLCKLKIVPTDRMPSFVNHISVWQFWKDYFPRS